MPRNSNAPSMPVVTCSTPDRSELCDWKRSVDNASRRRCELRPAAAAARRRSRGAELNWIAVTEAAAATVPVDQAGERGGFGAHREIAHGRSEDGGAAGIGEPGEHRSPGDRRRGARATPAR